MPELDACDRSFDNGINTSDANIDALILFADIDFEDYDAVEKRKAEWKELFS